MPARLVVLALLGSLLLPAVAQARLQETRVIRVISVQVKIVVNDTAPKMKANKGDSIVFRDALLNAAKQLGKAKGAHVGTDRGTLTYTSPRSARFDGTATLPGGTLILRGRVLSTKAGGMTIPVAGGTGKFSGAHGLLVVNPGSAKTPDRALNTYRLTIPTGLAA